MAQPAIEQSRPRAVPEGAPGRYDGLDQMRIGIPTISVQDRPRPLPF